jgi:hypothetical protein
MDEQFGEYRYLFDECQKGGDSPDEHWYLEPVCEQCHEPRSQFPHNEIMHPEHMAEKHPFVEPAPPLIWGKNAWRQNVCPESKPNEAAGFDHLQSPWHCSCPCHWLDGYHVNVYLVQKFDRNEGDWEDEITAAESIRCDTYRAAERVKTQETEKYQKVKAAESSNPNRSYVVLIEPTFARDQVNRENYR